MGMVTLVQQHQETAPDENRYQKDQDQVINIPTENRDSDDCREEIAHPLKDTAVVVAGNGSLAGSSTQCSDVEEEDDEDETDTDEREWIPDLPVPTVYQQHQQVSTADGNVVLPNAEASNFGDVRVKNSSNVHLGNKTFYKGPVTIKQFVYTNPVSVQENGNVKDDNEQTYDANSSASSAANNKEDSTANSSILSQSRNIDKVTKWLWTWRCAALMCTLSLILVITVIAVSVHFTSNSTAPPAPIFPEIPDSSLGVAGDKVKNVRFVERSEWGAQPPSVQLTKMKLPVPYVIISHTATEFCTTQSECTFHVRFAQTFHIESRKWSDIGYNFLVGGDGYVYVGRSWDYMGSHAFGFNNISIGISFIGTFNSVIPPKNQLYAAQRVIELGVEHGKISPDYKLLGHRQVSRTLSPGDALFSIIQTWPHWSSTP
ncbi:peptidoglycan-recognition protein LA-like isoform X1 [Osmia bicornis bicornis]|uniref:peptidoglycan-recognition protein LA-like isoform X1 n=1 Tax=Osmia bicornis bicornis TaxID=1437191 RepID=UPI001EAEAE1F|nr:peptidoglycan-recognition protein LA-like isoform X1 [Osmia bicornis bicornis]XP_029039732.2 peptidoglycan-recognition protein LA-like isoform X1 [Osmia bicornis bicornis]